MRLLKAPRANIQPNIFVTPQVNPPFLNNQTQPRTTPQVQLNPPLHPYSYFISNQPNVQLQEQLSLQTLPQLSDKPPKYSILFNSHHII